MFIKPAAGLKIRDPFKKDHLPEDGREVPDGDLYWERLRIDGDVIVVEPTAEIQRPKKSKSASSETDPG